MCLKKMRVSYLPWSSLKEKYTVPIHYLIKKKGARIFKQCTLLPSTGKAWTWATVAILTDDAEPSNLFSDTSLT